MPTAEIAWQRWTIRRTAIERRWCLCIWIQRCFRVVGVVAAMMERHHLAMTWVMWPMDLASKTFCYCVLIAVRVPRGGGGGRVVSRWFQLAGVFFSLVLCVAHTLCASVLRRMEGKTNFKTFRIEWSNCVGGCKPMSYSHFANKANYDSIYCNTHNKKRVGINDVCTARKAVVFWPVNSNFYTLTFYTMCLVWDGMVKRRRWRRHLLRCVPYVQTRLDWTVLSVLSCVPSFECVALAIAHICRCMYLRDGRNERIRVSMGFYVIFSTCNIWIRLKNYENQKKTPRSMSNPMDLMTFSN